MVEPRCLEALARIKGLENGIVPAPKQRLITEEAAILVQAIQSAYVTMGKHGAKTLPFLRSNGRLLFLDSAKLPNVISIFDEEIPDSWDSSPEAVLGWGWELERLLDELERALTSLVTKKRRGSGK